jgi:hypothetical protein
MENKKTIEDLLEDPINQTQTLDKIDLVGSDPTYSSTHFIEKDNFLKALVNLQSPSNAPFEEIDKKIKETQGYPSSGSGFIGVQGWKNIENISARLIEVQDDAVILECLIDKELGVYEEREFRISLFAGYDLKIGNLFYLRFFDRQNETRMEIHNDPKLTFADDFPKKDFTKLFKTSKLFKK